VELHFIDSENFRQANPGVRIHAEFFSNPWNFSRKNFQPLENRTHTRPAPLVLQETGTTWFCSIQVGLLI
jgi:hypothetical protein